LKAVRDFASELSDITMKMKAYEYLGESYMESKDYSNAIKSYKKLMQLSWREKNRTLELRAYEGLSITYYYLGDL
jgi:tetratricopeptide (TPR) repeat protein